MNTTNKKTSKTARDKKENRSLAAKMTDTCVNKNNSIFSKTSSNRKLIGQVTSKSLYPMIWIVNSYYLASGHCIWEVIIGKRSLLEMLVSKVTDSNLIFNNLNNNKCLECIKLVKMEKLVQKQQEVQKIESSHLRKFKIYTKRT